MTDTTPTVNRPLTQHERALARGVYLSAWQLAGAALLALLIGVTGAASYAMYTRHNLQHATADKDHELVNQMVPILQTLYQIEQKRQQNLGATTPIH